MSAMDYAGRVGQLCGLVSKPELNGVHVIIESYNPEKDRFYIKTLPPPNSFEEACVGVGQTV